MIKRILGKLVICAAIGLFAALFILGFNYFAPASDRLNVGTKPTLSFADGGSGVKYLQDGWSKPESWGVWSEKPTASLQLPLQKLPKGDLTLNLVIGAFVSAKHPREEVDITLNGEKVAHFIFTKATESQRQTIKLPLALIGKDKTLNLLFIPSAPISPKELGLGADTRSLGVSINELQLTP